MLIHLRLPLVWNLHEAQPKFRFLLKTGQPQTLSFLFLWQNLPNPFYTLKFLNDFKSMFQCDTYQMIKVFMKNTTICFHCSPLSSKISFFYDTLSKTCSTYNEF